jgi:hypothetical protein
MPRFPEETFRRYDESPDEEFYRTPRLVTHIDDRAITAVTQLYREHFPTNGTLLDLMSSWVSHLPPEIDYRRVVGLGMNEEELRRNPRLDEYVIQDLNRNPKLPFENGEFDGVGCCSWAAASTVAMIFSILTHISQPTRFCSAVARLRQMHGS